MCPDESNQPDHPEESSSDFHETEFYSQFQDQDGTLSEKENASESPSDEIDEEAIQELMDAALKKGGAPDPGRSDALDTTVRDDWAGAESAPPKTHPPRKPFASGEKKRVKPIPKRLVGAGGGTRRRNKVFSTRRMIQYLKVAVVATFFGLLALGVYLWGVLPRHSVQSTFAQAAALHEAGRYELAAELYEELETRSETAKGPTARLAFLRGGAIEQLWRAGQNREFNFRRTLSAYDDAIRSDATELRVYAVEAMLAKAEIRVEEAHRSDPVDRKLEREGWSVLAVLIDDPTYRVNPAVYQGVPHRRLAQWTREEDPATAIDLLNRARDAQGDLEEGSENLDIALIYRDLLGDSEKAEDFFERVQQNELASYENRRLAERALGELREGKTETDDFYSYDLFDTNSEVDPIEETMEP